MRIPLLPILLSLLLAAAACAQEKKKPAPRVKSGKMNISVFIYRDVNRNGIYDLGDRPYAGQQVRLLRPNGGPNLGASNISGFTNFKMSLNNPGYPIQVAGSYRIELVHRKNWRVTSGNEAQDLLIRELPGSPGGLIAQKTLEPIGIAPELFIEGILGKNLRTGTLTAISPEGSSIPVPVDDKGTYRFAAVSGAWTLEVQIPGQDKLRRTVSLKEAPVFLSYWEGENSYATEGKQDSIRFDELTTSDTLFEIPNGYGKLNWRNWIATHQKFYKGSGYINNTTSGEFAAYNSSGHPAAIHSKKKFSVIGFHIGVAWPQGERSPIRIRGLRDGKVIYDDIIRGKTAGPIFFAAQYHNIDTIDFETGQYWQIVLDDLIVATDD